MLLLSFPSRAYLFCFFYVSLPTTHEKVMDVYEKVVLLVACHFCLTILLLVLFLLSGTYKKNYIFYVWEHSFECLKSTNSKIPAWHSLVTLFMANSVWKHEPFSNLGTGILHSQIGEEFPILHTFRSRTSKVIAKISEAKSKWSRVGTLMFSLKSVVVRTRELLYCIPVTFLFYSLLK